MHDVQGQSKNGFYSEYHEYHSPLQKQGQHTRIAIQAVMGYFPVGKESHQREITELFLNQL